MSESFTARVIPAEGGGKVQITNGTKVMVGDVELQGVTRIVLTAEMDDVWRAEIHCHDSGRVRGLLCRTCNTAIGVLEKYRDKMSELMDYIDNSVAYDPSVTPESTP